MDDDRRTLCHYVSEEWEKSSEERIIHNTFIIHSHTLTGFLSFSSYTDKFEPYVIMRYRENMPLYDASFVGYGMNKIAYTMTLAAAGYHFHVLPSSWAIHLPHSESLESRQFVSGVDHRVANRLQRFRFLARLQADYGLEYCRDPSASADDIRWPC